MNFSLVKYIHLKDVDPFLLHTTRDYEFYSAVIGHSSYEEMEKRACELCPEGFVCLDPIALHHEVPWKTSLTTGKNGMVELDQLFRPIDAADYTAIRWGASRDDAHSTPICVQIEPRGVLILE